MKFDNIKIEWLGHATFRIKVASQVIYIDPFQLSGQEKADIVLITHSHYDHCSTEDITKITKQGTEIVVPADCQSKVARLTNHVKIVIAKLGDKLEAAGLKIETVPAYNTNKQFHPREQEWLGYVIEIEGKRIYHAGDTDLIDEMSSLKNIDIALLPVSGTYVMTAEEAVEAAARIKPKLAIPMHIGSIVGNKADANRFVELCKQKNIKAEKLEKSE